MVELPDRTRMFQCRRLVDAGIGLARDLHVIVDAKEPVLIEFQAALNRAIAESNVVCLGSGEVLLGGAKTAGRHEPEVGLKSVAEKDARFRVAARQHAL